MCSIRYAIRYTCMRIVAARQSRVLKSRIFDEIVIQANYKRLSLADIVDNLKLNPKADIDNPIGHFLLYMNIAVKFLEMC